MNQQRLLLGTLITFASALAACGGSFDLDETGAGGTGAGGTATGGTSTGATNSGGTSTGGTSYGGSGGWTYGGAAGEVTGGATWGGEGGASSCDGYRNEVIQPIDYKIQIVNKLRTPIYFGLESGGGCGGTPTYVLRRYGFPLPTEGGQCGSSCEQVMDNGPVMCDAACMAPTVTRLDPGGVLDSTWDGSIWENPLLPAACVGGGGVYGDWSCQRRIATPLDGVTVFATAWTQLTCYNDVDCNCTSVPGGSCQVFNAQVTGDSIPQEVQFNGGVATITFYDPLLW